MRTVLFMCCLLGVAEARAQAPATGDVPASLSAIAAFGVEMGEPLRIMRGEQLLKGRLVGVDERSFTLLGPSNSQPERVFFMDVQQLSVVRPSPGRGALVGDGVGLLTGLFLGTHLYALTSDYDMQGRAWEGGLCWAGVCLLEMNRFWADPACGLWGSRQLP